MQERPTVLIVDYDPKNVRVLTELFETSGYDVEVASDGISALTTFRENRPDIVLLEAMIPKKHGFEVCQEMKKVPDASGTPIIIMTAVYKGRKYRSQAMHDHGCDEYIEKPCPPEEILEMVKRFVPPGEIARAAVVGSPRIGAPAVGGNGNFGEVIPFPTRSSEMFGGYEDEAEQEIMSKLDEILPDTPVFDQRGYGNAASASSSAVQATSDTFEIEGIETALEEALGAPPNVLAIADDRPAKMKGTGVVLSLPATATSLKRRKTQRPGVQPRKKAKSGLSRGFVIFILVSAVLFVILLVLTKV